MEALLRIISIVLLVLTAFLVGLDTQTKIIFFTISRKATFRDLNALFVVVWIDSAAAVYNLLLLLIKCYIVPGLRKDRFKSYLYLDWGVYVLDQAAVYVVFAAHVAAIQASMLAVTGEKSFYWTKLCDKYTRFCIQIGGALVCGLLASVIMAITSSISAYALFRTYSPRQFLRLKGK